MRIADTSVLYALFAENDDHHGKALAAIADPDPIIVPGEIFAETIALIQYRKGFRAAVRAGDDLRGLEHVTIRSSDDARLEGAWSRFTRSDGQLSFPDAVVVAWCRSEGVKPLTFDRALRDAAQA